MASTYLSKTFSSSDSSGNGQKKFTVSAWLKRASIGSHHDVVSAYKASNGFQCDAIRIYNTDTFGSFSHSDSGQSGYNVRSNAVLRDTNAWYHLVTAVDTTQSTASNRVKLYINGEQVTSLASSTYPAQNESLIFGMPTDSVHEIGAVGTSAYFDGVMSHVHICFNQQYQASDFGSTDSTTGEWKINADPSVSYGSNGGWYLKDAANGTDYSTNSNTYAVNGTLTKTEDCPSNVFATFNPLDGATSLGDSEFSYGNNRWYSNTGSNKCWTRSTLGMTSGKYYFEMKIETASSNLAIGISDRPAPNLTTELGAGAYDYSYQSANSGNKYNNNSQSSYGNTYTTNDIVSCALDLDNLKVYFGKNGVWQNSGDPTSGSTGTGAAFTIASPSSTNGGVYFFCGADLTGGNATRLQANFGNGYFGTTAVSSAGTNASNNGIFEYDVPSGYTALSTKGLNL
jgi:hypothetical protein